MKRLTLPAIGLVALSLSVAPALAQSRGGSRGGSHSGGGSHHGGGSRSGGGSHYGGGHSGGGSHHRGGGSHYGGSRYGGSHYGHRSHIGIGFGYWYDPFWYGAWYGGPYGYYGYPYGYRYGYGGYGYGYAPLGDWAVVDTDVSPESARVYIDGQYVGTADDFDGYPDYLYLRRGRYRLEFQLPGFETRTLEVEARPGTKMEVNDSLAKIPGAAQYGSYDEPEPSGGVRRFWGKRRDVAEAITGDDEIYEPGPPRHRQPGTGDDDRYADEHSGENRGDDANYDDSPPAPADERPAPREEWRDRGAARAQMGDTWLRLNVQPADAAIYLDDRFIGTASALDAQNGIAVPPGHHALVVSRPGYRDRRIEVDVVRGKTERVDIKLER